MLLPRFESMTPAELKAIIGALVAAVCFFLVREFSRKDKIATDLQTFKEAMGKTIEGISQKFTDEIRQVAERNTLALERLNHAVAELGMAITEQKAWFVERYVHWDDHEKDMAQIRADIKAHAERFENELQQHLTTCPAMRR